MSCPYCGNKVRWYHRKGSIRQYHYSCQFILENNGTDAKEYMKKRLEKLEGKK